MSGAEERYAIISIPERRLLARWLRPLEAAAYVETYNRLVTQPLHRAQMAPEPVEEQPAKSPRK
jgi:hypothetical protein